MKKLHVLTSLSFGVHSPRRCQYRALLSDYEKKRFVIIVAREEQQQADGRLEKALKHVVSRVWDKNNPFCWGDESEAHRVVALEVEWSAIVGIDYRYPLHDDGKLVLEARHVTKRCFKTVEDAWDFYTPRSSVTGIRMAPLRMSQSAAPTPQKLSLDERRVVRRAGAAPNHRLPPELVVGSPFLNPGIAWPAALADIASLAGAVVGGTNRSGGSSGARYPSSGQKRSMSASRMGSRSTTTMLPDGEEGWLCSGVSHRGDRDSGYVSADDGAGPGRQRKQALGSGLAARAGALGNAFKREVRRRLQLRLEEPSCGEPSGSEPSGGEQNGSGGSSLRLPLSRSHMTRLTLSDEGPASPRRARSANDLVGMDGASGNQAGGQAVGSSVAATSPGTSIWVGSSQGLGLNNCRFCGMVIRGSAGHGICSNCGNSSSNNSSGSGNRCISNVGESVSRPLRHPNTSSEGCGASARTSTSNGFGPVLSGRSDRDVGLGPISAIPGGSPPPGRRVSSARGRSNGALWSLGVAAAAPAGGGGGPIAAAAMTGAAGAGGPKAAAARGAPVSSAEQAERDVPRASRGAQPSATYGSTTLVLSFRDPMLPQELRRFVKSDMRLLKLYESGLPSWAVFLPSYGLPYRPWLRRALWLLFIAVSVVSMGCGFYDLYKNIPFLKQVVTAIASRMYLPASELFEWLERHTQIRMSILLTYLFSKSPLFVSFMRMLRNLIALLQQLLAPAVATASQLAKPLVAAAEVSGRHTAALLAVVLGPPVRAFWALAMFIAHLGRQLAGLAEMVLVWPTQLLSSVGGALSLVGSAVAEELAAAWEGMAFVTRYAMTLLQAVQRMAPAMTAGARVAAQAAGNAAAVAGGSSGGGGGISGGMAVWQWLGLEVVGAYNAVRLTFLQAFKSARAVINFCVTVAQTAVQHRVSLLLQLRRFVTRHKDRLPPAVAKSAPIKSFVNNMQSFDMPNISDGHHDELLDPGIVVATELGSDVVPPDVTATHPHPHAQLFELEMAMLGSGHGPGPEIAGGGGGGVGGGPLPGMSLEQDEQQPLYGDTGGGFNKGGGGGYPMPIPSNIHNVSGGVLRRRVVSGGRGAAYSTFPYNRLDSVHEELEGMYSTYPGLGSVVGSPHGQGLRPARSSRSLSCGWGRPAAGLRATASMGQLYTWSSWEYGTLDGVSTEQDQQLLEEEHWGDAWSASAPDTNRSQWVALGMQALARGEHMSVHGGDGPVRLGSSLPSSRRVLIPDVNQGWRQSPSTLPPGSPLMASPVRLSTTPRRQARQRQRRRNPSASSLQKENVAMMQAAAATAAVTLATAGMGGTGPVGQNGTDGGKVSSSDDL